MKKIFSKLLKSANDDYRYGPIVDLKERYRLSELMAYDGIPTVFYSIYLHGSDIKVGECDLRLKIDERMYYYGHIGYHIDTAYRGNHYAYRACQLLFEIAYNEFNIDELIITCNPDNIPSYKTLKALGGLEKEIIAIPENHELYWQGDREKCVFVYDLRKMYGEA